MGSALVPAGPRSAFDTGSESWNSFGDDAFLHPSNGAVDENDNIEALEERARRAKKEAQAKRKQIPPFVQKLSR
jgi:heat shock transcription factor